MEGTPICNYYGQLDGPLLGNNLGHYIVDEAFQRLLEKYEQKIIDDQAKLITGLKKEIANEIKKFNKSQESMFLRLAELEKKTKRNKPKEKEEKDAINQRKEGQDEKRNIGKHKKGKARTP